MEVTDQDPDTPDTRNLYMKQSTIRDSKRIHRNRSTNKPSMDENEHGNARRPSMIGSSFLQRVTYDKGEIKWIVSVNMNEYHIKLL